MSFDTISANQAFIGSVFTDEASFENLEYNATLLKNDVVVNGSLTVANDLFLSDVPIVQTGSGKNILGDTDVENLECTTLQVNGSQTLNDVVINNALTVSGTLIHTGEVASFGNITASGLEVFSTLDVTNLEVPGNLTIDGFLKVQNQTEVSTLNTVSCDELEVTSSLSTPHLEVTNAVALSGPLNVTGIITQSTLPSGIENNLQATRVNGTLSCNQVSAASLSTQTVNVTGTLNAGSATIPVLNLTSLSTNTLAVNTTASIPSITSSVNVTGNVTVNGEATFNGTATFNDDVYIDNQSLLVFGTDAGILQTSGNSNTFRASTFLANVTVSDGEVQLSAKGIRFPDGTIQTTAAGKNLPSVIVFSGNTSISLTSAFTQLMTYTFPTSSLARYFKVQASLILRNATVNTVGDVFIELLPQTYTHGVHGTADNIVTFMEPTYIAPNQSLTISLRLRHSNLTGSMSVERFNVAIEQSGPIESISVT